MKKTISGIRGIFGRDLDLKNILEFCNNFSSLIKSQKCVIGKDTRPTSNMIKNVASAALMKNGVNVFNFGTVPTPVVFREARLYGAGIIVTSSHNPIEWNGLKFIIDGRGVNENELPQIINHQNISSSKIGVEEDISSSSYINDAKEIIGDVTNHPKIVIDVGGGAAKNFVSNLLSEIGCSVESINNDITNCTRGPDPTLDSLSDLINSCDKRDVGFAFDLDGDRLVVVKNGQKQVPDVTLGLGIAKSLELGYKKFVLSVDTSISIEKFILEKGGTVQISKVGEANVTDMMLKNNFQAGGEGSSGGFILPKFNYCRDGILTCGLIATMLESAEFDEILKYMESYHQTRTKIAIDSSLHDNIMKTITSKFSDQYSETSMLDGIKGIIDENTWVLIRKSNTENIIRISAESNNKEKCNKIINDTLIQVRNIHDNIK